MDYINEKFKIKMTSCDLSYIINRRMLQIKKLWYHKQITKKDALKMINILERQVLLLIKEDALQQIKDLRNALLIVEELRQDEEYNWLYGGKQTDDVYKTNS